MPIVCIMGGCGGRGLPIVWLGQTILPINEDTGGLATCGLTAACFLACVAA